jgi:hypothetical protein
VKATQQLLEIIAIGEVPAMKGRCLQVRLPRNEMIRQTNIGALTRFAEKGWIRLEVGMAMVDKKLEEGQIAILMLSDDLGHGRVGEEACRFILEGRSK